jgi:hypothetical protein
MARRKRAIAALVALGLALVALPALAASPSPSPGKSGTAKPEKSHAPEKPVTLHGTVSAGKDEKGRPSYTLTVGGTTYDLSAGPPWFWGDKNPLAAYVGQTVDVVGEQSDGSTEVDVESVNGKALRAPGKPPWAGGPKAVGPAHPGYKAWKAARDKSIPPGQQKDKGRSDDTEPSASPNS